jgi:hypothetical protein
MKGQGKVMRWKSRIIAVPITQLRRKLILNKREDEEMINKFSKQKAKNLSLRLNTI